MRNYMIGLTLFGFLPLLYAIIYYFSDVYTYLTFEDEEELEKVHIWQVNFMLLESDWNNACCISMLNLW